MFAIRNDKHGLPMRYGCLWRHLIGPYWISYPSKHGVRKPPSPR